MATTEQHDPEPATAAPAAPSDPPVEESDLAEEPDPTADSDPTAEPDPATEPDPTEAAAAPADDRWAAFAPTPEKRPGRIRRAAGAVGALLGHEWTLVSAGAVALAVLLTWPALRYPAYTLPQDLGDPTLVSWMLAWPGHILLSDPSSLWHGNAFFPERWSYVFTDTLLGYAPAGLIGDGPAAALVRYNILYVLVHALAFVGAYALARQLGVDRIAALVPALAFAYAPWRLAQAGHLHVLSTGAIALALAMLARGHGWTLRRKGFTPRKVRPGWIIAGWLVAAWQISLGWGIGLPFAYVLLGIGVGVSLTWVVRRIRRRPRQRIRRIVVANLIGGAVFGAVAVLMALPYLAVVEEHPQARRNFNVLYDFSPPLRGFFTAPEESWLWGALHAPSRELVTWPPEMALLPGFALLGLAAAGLWFSVWSIKVRVALAAGVLVSVLLAMGTELLDGVIYRQLHEFLPGWDALRTPGRLIIWTTLLLSILAAGALAGFRERSRELAVVRRGSPAPGPWLRFAALVPVVLVLLEGLNTTPHEVVPRPPAALATASGPVLVLPTNQETDQLVMLWTTDRFQPVVNGGSGFTPATLYEIRQVTPSFPDQESVSFLRSLGVATVVVLPDRIAGTPWEQVLQETGEELGVAREDVDGAVLFHLDGP